MKSSLPLFGAVVATSLAVMSVADARLIYSTLGTDAGSKLVVVDPATGAITSVGNTGVPGISSLAYNPADGKLYASEGRQLFTLDPFSGNATFVAALSRAGTTAGTGAGGGSGSSAGSGSLAPTADSSRFFRSISFTSEGNFYGISDTRFSVGEMMTLNPVDGTYSTFSTLPRNAPNLQFTSANRGAYLLADPDNSIITLAAFGTDTSLETAEYQVTLDPALYSRPVALTSSFFTESGNLPGPGTGAGQGSGSGSQAVRDAYDSFIPDVFTLVDFTDGVRRVGTIGLGYGTGSGSNPMFNSTADFVVPTENGEPVVLDTLAFTPLTVIPEPNSALTGLALAGGFVCFKLGRRTRR